MDKEVLIKVGYDVDVNISKADDAISKLQKQLDDLNKISISTTDTKELDILNDKIKFIKDQIDLVNKTYIEPKENITKSLEEARLKSRELLEAGKENTQEYYNTSKAIQGLLKEQNELTTATNNLDVKSISDFGNSFKAIEQNAKNTNTSIFELTDQVKYWEDVQGSTKDPLQLKEANQTIKDLKENIKDLKLPENSFKSAKVQLREAKDEAYALAMAGEDNTARYAELLKKIGDIKDAMDDTNAAAESFSPDQWGKFVGIAGNLVSTLGGIESSMQLIGIESETAERGIQKLMAIQGIVNALGAMEDLQVQWASLRTNIFKTIPSMKGLTASTKALRIGLIGLGIGLIITAIALLIHHFDSIKESVMRFLQPLEKVGNFFKTIFTSITDFLHITSEAGRELENTTELVAKQNEQLENHIKILEALGGREKEVFEARRKIAIANIELLRLELIEKKKITDEDHKRINDLQTALTLLDINENKRLKDNIKKANETAKKGYDEAKKLRDAELTELKKFNDEANKILYGDGKSTKDIELKELSDKYKVQLDLAKKLGKDTLSITKAFQVEEKAIIEKYDNDYVNYINGVSNGLLSAYDKQYIELGEKAIEAKKNATDEQKEAIDNQLELERLHINDLKNLAIDKQNILINLSKVEGDNVISEFDSPDEILRKSLAINKAKIDAETILNKEQLLLKENQIESILAEEQRLQDEILKLSINPDVNAAEIDNLQLRLNGIKSTHEIFYSELEQLKQDHENTIKAIDQDSANAKIEIEKLKRDAELERFDIVADALSASSQLLSEHTIASKAMAVAESTINTYTAGSKALASAPPPFNYILMGATIASGMSNIKKILSVKIPNVKGEKSLNITPNVSAPVINSTVLSQAKSGNTNVVDAVNENTQSKKNEPLRAYIINSDLKSQAEKDNFLNTISSF